MRQYLKQITKIIRKTLLVIFSFTLLLTSCNQKSITNSDDSGAVTITFADFKSFQNQYEELIEEFESTNPGVNVQFVQIDSAASGPNLDHSKLVSLADIMMLPSQPQGTDIYNYLDIEPILEADHRFDSSAFWPGSLDGCRVEGRLVGFPVTVQTLLVMYDGTAFDKAGLDRPAPGWSWNDFEEAALLLTERTGDEASRYGFVDYGQPTTLLAPLMDAAYIHAGEKYDPATLAEAIDWYVGLAQAGAIPVNVPEEGSAEPVDYVSTGQAAMWVDALSSLEKRHQDLGDAVGAAPFPETAIGSEGQTTQAWATCALVSAGTTHQQEAWAWLQFLASRQIPGSNPFAIPANITGADDSGYWNSLDARTATAVRYALNHAWYGSNSKLPFNAIDSALNKAVAREINLVEALDSIQVDVVTEPSVPPKAPPVVVATPKPTVASVTPSADTFVVDYFVWSNYHTNMDVLEDLAQEFNQKHPKIIIQLIEDQNADLPFINFDLVAENYDCFAAQTGTVAPFVSLLFDLQPLSETDPDGQKLLNDLPESELSRNRSNGDLYALPVADRPTVMYYNKDIFVGRGMQPPTLNWTWDDFWAAAIAVASEDVYGFVPLNGREFVNMLLTDEGIELYNLSSETPVINFNDPKVTRLVAILADMAKNGVIPLIDENIDWRKSNAGFRYNAVESGKAAMWMDMAGLDYGMFVPPEGLDFEVGVAPLPSSDNPLLPHEGGVSLYISRQADNPNACWEWFKYLSDKPEVFIGIPLRQSVLASEQYEQIIGADLANAYRVVMAQPREEMDLDYQEQYPSYPLYIWWPNTLTAIFDGVPPAQALTDIQRNAEKYLACLTIASDPLIEDIWVGCAQQADPSFEMPQDQ